MIWIGLTGFGLGITTAFVGQAIFRWWIGPDGNYQL